MQNLPGTFFRITANALAVRGMSECVEFHMPLGYLLHIFVGVICFEVEDSWICL